MKKAALLSILVVVVQLAVGVIAQAQQPAKVPRIGYIHLNPPEEIAHLTKAFESGFADAARPRNEKRYQRGYCAARYAFRSGKIAAKRAMTACALFEVAS